MADDTPPEGTVGLDAFIASLRADLEAAALKGKGHPLVFGVGPITLDVEVAVTKTVGGEAGVKIWLFTLGGNASREKATTHKLSLTLTPHWMNPQTGQPTSVEVLVADVLKERPLSAVEAARNRASGSGDGA